LASREALSRGANEHTPHAPSPFSEREGLVTVSAVDRPLSNDRLDRPSTCEAGRLPPGLRVCSFADVAPLPPWSKPSFVWSSPPSSSGSGGHKSEPRRPARDAAATPRPPPTGKGMGTGPAPGAENETIRTAIAKCFQYARNVLGQGLRPLPGGGNEAIQIAMTKCFQSAHGLLRSACSADELHAAPCRLHRSRIGTSAPTNPMSTPKALVSQRRGPGTRPSRMAMDVLGGGCPVAVLNHESPTVSPFTAS